MAALRWSQSTSFEKIALILRIPSPCWHRLSGGGAEAYHSAGRFPMDPMTHLTPEAS